MSVLRRVSVDMMLRLIRISIIAVLAVVATAPVYGQDTVQWQLVFEYGPGSLSLIKASEIAPMAKSAQTPGLTGAKAIVEAAAEWRDTSGRSVWTGNIQIPLGGKMILDAGEPCEDYIPTSGIVVVRTQGPLPTQQPTSLSLLPSATSMLSRNASITVPDVFQQAHSLPMPPLDLVEQRAQRVPGPFAAAKIRDTGPDANRLVIVVVGDGYTAADHSNGYFIDDSTGLLNAFLAKAPWDTYFAFTNVYRVDIESAQSGADYEDGPTGTLKDTYLHARFWTGGIERLLTITNAGAIRAVDAADAWVGPGVWDYIFVLVNSFVYGGAGGSISVSSVHPAASEVILHEFGHTFANLADEYDYGGGSLIDPEPNVDLQFTLGALKWNVWVEQGTPLPTPETIAYDNVVGAFNGARYVASGIYRPWLSCLMESLSRPFCPVCKEAHVMQFFNIVSLAESFTPPLAIPVNVREAGTTMSVTPLSLGGLQYEWRINGNLIPLATGPGVTVVPGQLTNLVGPDTLTLTARHPTALVRKAPVAQSYSWTLISLANTLEVAWVRNTYQGVEQGTFPNPFNTFDEAVEAVVPGGDVILRLDSRTLDDAISIDKPMTISARDTP